MDHIRPLSKRVVFLTGRHFRSNDASSKSNQSSSNDHKSNSTTKSSQSSSPSTPSSSTSSSFHIISTQKVLTFMSLALLSILFIAFISFHFASQNIPQYATLPSFEMPMNQPRLSSEDWDSIRHLLNQQSHHLLQTFTNHSHSQHILAQRPIPSCQSLIAEKQTTVQLSHLIVQQLSAVQLTDLTVNPNLDLISILLRFQNPTLSAHFKYQMNASIDRNDIFNQSYDLLASGRVSLQASDWKLAVFAQLHHFDNDAQRVYLRDVELRSFISPDRLHSTLSINQTSSPITQTQIGAIRSALSDCMSEQLRVLLEARVAQYIKSHLLCNPTTSAQCPPLESPALSFAQHLNGKPYRPSIAFYTHDLEHVLRLNATTLSAFHNHQNLSESVLPPDLAKRLTEEEQRGSIPSEPLFEPNVRQQFDQQLEQLLNKALLDMNAPSFADAALDDEWKASAVSEPEPDETDADESEVSESDPLNRSKRQVPCERGQELDEYVDSLFRFASRIVRAMEPFALPNATIDLPEYNMKLFLHHGGATRAYTLTRKRAAWVYCTNESVSLGLTVGFEDLRIKYKYRAIKDWSLLWDGELEAKLEHTKLQVQFTQTTPDEDSDIPVMQRVDRIRIWRVGHVRVMIKGLGNLTQGVSMLLTNMLNQNVAQLDPTLRVFEKEAVQIANRMLQNISIPFFSII